jgi:miniconductance mechanosensitive channel
VILILWIIRTIFNALRDYLKLKPRYSDKPIDIQVIMIILWMSVIIIISRLFEIGRFYFWGCFRFDYFNFQGYYFRFVASVQVAINDMIRIGDWITINKLLMGCNRLI